MKRVAKIITVFILSLSVILCSSFSVFAYHPVISVKSSDWNIVSDDTYSGVYPNKIPGHNLFEDYVYKHEELNGSTYYTSRFSDDNYYQITKSDVTIPQFPQTDSWAFGSWLPDFDKIVFKCGYSFYCAFIQGFNKVYLTESNLLNFDVTGVTGEIDYYKFTYPFSTWQYDSYVDYYGGDNLISFNIPNPVDIVWSTIDIYSADKTKITHKADNNDIQGTKHEIEYETPVSVLTGTMSVTVDKDSVSRLSFGSFALLFKNFGFVCGYDTGLLSYSYSLTIRKGIDLSGTAEIMAYSYDSTCSDYGLDVGEAYINNTFDVLDINYDMSQDVEFIFNYKFVSDSYHLYFPGSIDFVEFENYEDDMEHDEVMNAINDAATVIGGSVTSASSELASEIASTYDKLVTSTQPKPDLSIDTGKVDNIVAEEEEILNNIYDDINSRTDEYLKVIGFSSLEGLFDEKINDLNNDQLSASFDFVKSLFDQVVSATGVSTLLFFSLCFGFCIFVLGRRLS